MRKNRLLVRAIGVITLVAAVTACGGSNAVRLAADAAGTELYEQGQQFTAEEKWRQAGEAYDALLRNYPTSPFLPDARLGLGRAYYEQGRSGTLLLAIDAFRNFMTYHPSHPQVDYAQLMVGMSYVKMMRSTDRDQTNSRRAMEAFQIFMEDYPESSYIEIARDNMQTAVDSIAGHELEVAEWQLGRNYYAAAQARAHYTLRKYPQTSRRCRVLYVLAEAYRRGGDEAQGRATYERILQEHPDCEYADEARERLG
jgi:outer membrane protein assembly factor BamD